MDDTFSLSVYPQKQQAYGHPGYGYAAYPGPYSYPASQYSYQY